MKKSKSTDNKIGRTAFLVFVLERRVPDHKHDTMDNEQISVQIPYKWHENVHLL